MKHYLKNQSFSSHRKVTALSNFSKICQNKFYLANIFQLHKHQTFVFINLCKIRKRQRSSGKFKLGNIWLTITNSLKILRRHFRYFHFPNFNLTFVKSFIKKTTILNLIFKLFPKFCNVTNFIYLCQIFPRFYQYMRICRSKKFRLQAYFTLLWSVNSSFPNLYFSKLNMTFLTNVMKEPSFLKIIFKLLVRFNYIHDVATFDSEMEALSFPITGTNYWKWYFYFIVIGIVDIEGAKPNVVMNSCLDNIPSILKIKQERKGGSDNLVRT